MLFAVSSIVLPPGGKSDNPYLAGLGYATILPIPFELIFYITNAFRNTSIPKEKRGGWALLLFVASFVVFPFYWYHHIWHDAKQAKPVDLPGGVSHASRQTAGPISKRLKIIILGLSLIPVLTVVTVLLLLYLGSWVWVEHYELIKNISGAVFLVSTLGMLAFYMTNVFRNRNVAENQRVLWLALLLLGNVPIFLIYWFLYIWPEPKKLLP